MDLRVYQRIKHRKKRILLCIAAVLLLAGALAAMLHVAQIYQNKLGDGWTMMSTAPSMNLLERIF